MRTLIHPYICVYFCMLVFVCALIHIYIYNIELVFMYVTVSGIDIFNYLCVCGFKLTYLDAHMHTANIASEFLHTVLLGLG